MLGPASVLWLAEHQQADQQGVWLALAEDCGGLAFLATLRSTEP